MKSLQSILEHRVEFPENSRATTHPTLIMLHGRGADEEDLVGLSQYYDRRLLVLSVRAPFPFTGGGGYTWYDVGEVGTPEPTMFKTSYGSLSQFIDDALKFYPIDPARLFLLGFSMGTVMSFALSLTRPALFHGVLAYSGYVPERTSLHFQWKALSHLGYFITHGTQDPVIPIAFARRTRDLFLQSNAHVTYKEYPIGHQLSEEGLADSVVFFNRLLGNTQE